MGYQKTLTLSSNNYKKNAGVGGSRHFGGSSGLSSNTYKQKTSVGASNSARYGGSSSLSTNGYKGTFPTLWRIKDSWLLLVIQEVLLMHPPFVLSLDPYLLSKVLKAKVDTNLLIPTVNRSCFLSLFSRSVDNDEAAGCFFVTAASRNSRIHELATTLLQKKCYLLYGSAGGRMITAAGGRSYKENNRSASHMIYRNYILPIFLAGLSLSTCQHIHLLVSVSAVTTGYIIPADRLYGSYWSAYGFFCLPCPILFVIAASIIGPQTPLDLGHY
ncbi:hypothetical protein Tco_1252367 [Tanacetum coccineum]